MPTTRNLAILIFDDVEVLDFCGPFDLARLRPPRSYRPFAFG